MVITYTEEMVEQDTLLKNNNESVEKMEQLHRVIVRQAHEAGLIKSGVTISYGFPHRVETKITKKDAATNSNKEITLFSCNELIKAIEVNNNESQLRFAIKRAIEDFSPSTILEIMNSENEEERFGWSKDAETLNEVSLEEVKRALTEMKLL